MRHKIALHTLFWGRQRFILITAVDSGAEARGEVAERCEQLGEVTAGRFQEKGKITEVNGRHGRFGSSFPLCSSSACFHLLGQTQLKGEQVQQRVPCSKSFSAEKLLKFKIFEYIMWMLHLLWTWTMVNTGSKLYILQMYYSLNDPQQPGL